MAENPVVQILLPAEEIEGRIRSRIEHERVDREVSTSGGLSVCDRRIEFHFKSLVAGRDFGVAAALPSAASATAATDANDDFDFMAEGVNTKPLPLDNDAEDDDFRCESRHNSCASRALTLLRPTRVATQRVWRASDTVKSNGSDG